jgi:hypothetical protein
MKKAASDMVMKKITMRTTAPLPAMMNMARKRIMTTITMKTTTTKKKSINSPIRGMTRMKMKTKAMTTTGTAGEMTIMITIMGRETAPMTAAAGVPVKGSRMEGGMEGAGVLLPMAEDEPTMTEDDPPDGRVKAGIRRVTSRAAVVRLLVQVIRTPVQVVPVPRAGRVPVQATVRSPGSPVIHRAISRAVAGLAQVQAVPVQVPVGQAIPAGPMVAAIPAKAGIRRDILRAAAAGQAMASGPIRAAAAAIVAATANYS